MSGATSKPGWPKLAAVQPNSRPLGRPLSRPQHPGRINVLCHQHPRPDSAHVSHGKTIQHPQNRILAALPADEFRRLAPHLTETPLTFKRSLSKPGQPITHVCFPDSGVCSVMAVTHSGAAAEVGTVGNEGVTGLALFFGETSEPTESMIQVPGRGACCRQTSFGANWRTTQPSIGSSVTTRMR